MKKEVFKGEVYPFTTEEIATYFSLIDFYKKKVFTVGSSFDQVLNALLLGSKDVLLYDINENAKEFSQIKMEIIKDTPSREEMYKKVLDVKDVPLSNDLFSYDLLTKMNYYMSSDENYEKLRNILKLKDYNLRYIQGDILDISCLKDEKFDVMILSNILQYLPSFVREGESDENLFKQIFKNFYEHLNNDGLLQLLYYYGFTPSLLRCNYQSYKYLRIMLNLLCEEVKFEEFNNSNANNSNDAVLLYRKKGK